LGPSQVISSSLRYLSTCWASTATDRLPQSPPFAIASSVRSLQTARFVTQRQEIRRKCSSLILVLRLAADPLRRTISQLTQPANVMQLVTLPKRPVGSFHTSAKWREPEGLRRTVDSGELLAKVRLSQAGQQVRTERHGSRTCDMTWRTGQTLRASRPSHLP
jgi:hypothetical protein